MKKLFLVSVSVLCLLLFSATAKAETITIDFDTIGFAEAAAQGISFENAQVVAGENAKGDDGYKLGATDYNQNIVISFTKPLFFVSCDKWELGSQEEVETVYWKFTFSDQSDQTFSNSGSGWTRNITNSGISGQTLDKIEIWGGATTGNYFLDNIKFTSVPEPSTILLLILGFAGLAGLRKKQ